MYLDVWMIITIILSFGLCHVISRRQGVTAGAVGILRLLENEKIIKISDDGSVTRYSTWNEQPNKKKRKSNVKI